MMTVVVGDRDRFTTCFCAGVYAANDLSRNTAFAGIWRVW